MDTPNTIHHRHLAEYCVDTILHLSADHEILYASPACMPLLGYTPEEMRTFVPSRDLIDPRDLPILQKTRQVSDQKGQTQTRTTMRWRRKNGAVVWIESHTRVIRDPETGRPREFILVLRDISDRKALEDQLAALAVTDALTGLGNRRAFDEALSREWQRTLRDGTPTSLLLIDLDHFKKLNDRYGHPTGDDCLRAVARALGTVVRREMDILARYGGEELAVILPGLDYEAALHVATNACRAVEWLRIPHADNTGGLLTISIGVATALARHGGSMSMPESLLLAADSALYKAKHQGRNRAVGSLLLTKAKAA